MFDPDDFRKLAASMTQGACGAAQSRTAISRSYYAAFLVARQFLERYFHFERHGESHVQVRMLFLGCTNEEARRVGRHLDELRDRRNDADYDLNADDVNDFNNARLYVAIAARTIKRIKEFSEPGQQDALITEMRQWAAASGKVRARQSPV